MTLRDLRLWHYCRAQSFAIRMENDGTRHVQTQCRANHDRHMRFIELLNPLVEGSVERDYAMSYQKEVQDKKRRKRA